MRRVRLRPQEPLRPELARLGAVLAPSRPLRAAFGGRRQPRPCMRAALRTASGRDEGNGHCGRTKGCPLPPRPVAERTALLSADPLPNLTHPAPASAAAASLVAWIIAASGRDADPRHLHPRRCSRPRLASEAFLDRRAGSRAPARPGRPGCIAADDGTSAGMSPRATAGSFRRRRREACRRAARASRAARTRPRGRAGPQRTSGPSAHPSRRAARAPDP
jgi:hypothetical protein